MTIIRSCRQKKIKAVGRKRKAEGGRQDAAHNDLIAALAKGDKSFKAFLKKKYVGRGKQK